MKGYRSFVFFTALVLSCVLFAGCESYQEKRAKLTDTEKRGRIIISADESFKPVVDAQVAVYESNNPGTTIAVQYKPEAECLKDLLNDSIRMIIATRKASPAEEKFLTDSLLVGPVQLTVARDAVAVIVHPGAPDSLFTMNELKAVLTGKFKKNLIPVFDGVQATSTVRFIVDSVLHDEALTPKAMAASTSEEVINYVATHPDAVGFIGVSWIGNKDDGNQLSFLKKVRIAQLESTDTEGSYVLPVQLNIYMKRYPMVRDLVYILKEKHKGLGNGFADFMSGQIGQLIFRRAYLVPTQKKFTLRPVQLRDE
ncbi:substrate-binding domain-containing protein [Terrimonas sp. NA20]|uniref:Substrate-binding domain-containing protein n=1 Tax=Terrimonas ginsenosidimutans TaxID=2908004 RepID=A0ABS9KVM6_9BACT|nr:substrate-binding domain-containing protein [Terrimonas ginsenosidimutans]MCG2616366.1 substrate-binding domain-containing protein [Terrimonas ginsenosidimutans]